MVQGCDLLTSDVSELRASFDVSVTGLVVAVQKALPDSVRACCAFRENEAG